MKSRAERNEGIPSAGPAVPPVPPRDAGSQDRAYRAPKGGAVGVNGSFYEGGKFLPQNPERVKESPPPQLAKGAKYEVDWRQWSPAPADWHVAIYPAIKEFSFVRDGRAELRQAWSKPEAFSRYLGSLRSGGYNGSVDGTVFMQEIQGLIEAYNRGDRWSLATNAPPGTVLVQRPTQENGPGMTLVVDGVVRSTTNSLGKRIAPTEEGIHDFWKWFGDSQVVDVQGRPLVVYHGTKAATFGGIEEGEVRWDLPFAEFDATGRTEPGVYFTPSLSVARHYGTPVPFYLRALAPVRAEAPLARPPEGADAIYRMRGTGDAIAQAWEIAVFHPDQIRSSQPTKFSQP